MLSTATIARRLRRTLLAAAACFLMAAVACDRDSANGPVRDATPAPDALSASALAYEALTAEEVLERSRAAVSTIESYRFTGEWVLGHGQDGQRWIRSGEWTAPDRYRLRFDGIDRTAGKGQELLVIGADGYFRPAGRDRWVQLEVSPATVDEASGEVIPPVGDVAFLGEAQPDENGVFHLTGTAGTGQAGQSESIGSPAFATTYSLAIRASDFLPLELVIETPNARFDPAQGAWRLDPALTQRLVVQYRDFDVPVTIEVPAQIKSPDGESGRVSQAQPDPG